ncbi:MAG: hypothetical protein JNN15_12745 [Blastocatellia bacterium]|nr:hypothetical protein [Blastocatellia bacterium]
MNTELISCPKCSRKNNPLRGKCIYCGEVLPTVEKVSASLVTSRASYSKESDSSLSLDPLLQISNQLQQSLQGFYIVALPFDLETGQQKLSRLSLVTGMPEGDIKQLLKTNFPMPVMKVNSELEATAIVEELGRDNIVVRTVSDETLQPASHLQRMRKLTLEGDLLITTTENLKSSPTTLNPKDIILIVEGSIKRKQTHIVEENKGFGKTARELKDAVEFRDETQVVDIYSDSLTSSFRVRSESFDYSGFGSRMRLTALENFRMLMQTLQEVSVNAYIDTGFRKICKLLDSVWPLTSRSQSTGLKRAEFLAAGKFATSSVQYFDNELQFNRYSRILYMSKKLEL